jgi:hypothetical protein
MSTKTLKSYNTKTQYLSLARQKTTELEHATCIMVERQTYQLSFPGLGLVYVTGGGQLV